MKIIDTLYNLFCSDEKFFDKEATIKEYFAVVPEGKRKNFDSYEELYKEALKFVGKQDFKKNTENSDNYFYEITSNEGLIAVMLGVIAFSVARDVDINGTKIEAAIDKMLPKDYDVNNPFDVKKGYGHRVFGHDPVAFGLKIIPGDLLIEVKNLETGIKSPVKIGEFLGKDVTEQISMWDLIWKFHGSKNISKGLANCFSHIIVHFAKDIFTPAGLPLPLLSIFNKYEKFKNDTISGIKYQGSLMQELDKRKLNMKASDFASYFLIESFLHFYCNNVIKEKNIKDKEGFKRNMKLIAMGTCISLQMATIILGQELQVGKKGNKPMIPGGKVNLLMSGAFFKIVIKDLKLIFKARREISKAYKGNYMR